jgi:hypothetical protein
MRAAIASAVSSAPVPLLPATIEGSSEEEAMPGAVSMRLAHEKTRHQFAAEDLELLRRHRLVDRDSEGVWSVCWPFLTPSVERLVELVLTTPTRKEAT